MSVLEKNSDKIRPCVFAALKSGAQDRDHLKKMTHAIIYEFDRLQMGKADIKMILLDWNLKSYRVLSAGDAKRQLCGYVDWFFKLKDRKLSCKALEVCCVYPNGGCAFKPAQCREGFSLPFSLLDAMAYLEKEYRPHGYLMGLLLKVLFAVQKDKNSKNIIFVGVRELRARLNHDEGHNLDIMTILRALNMLEEVGIIKITHGKSGTFGTRQANGYTFLEWTPPMKKEEQPPMRMEEKKGEGGSHP